MHKKILVSGSLAYDHIMIHDGEFHEIILPEHVHHLNVCFIIKDKSLHFGGTGGNIAYNLRLLGENIILLGLAGKDFQEYKHWLEKFGVDTSQIKIEQNIYTASAFITSDRKGNQITNFYPGAMDSNHCFNLEPLAKDIAIAIISPDNIHRMLNMCLQCKKLTIPYLFDPGQQLPNFTPHQLLECIDKAEGVILNEYELELLLNKTNLTKKDLCERIHLLIITRGEKGSTIEEGEKKEEIGISETKKIIDPTGCGDAYRAGILKGLKKRYSRKTMGQMAALMGTYSVEKKGTQNHFFTRDEFEKRYKKSFKTETPTW
ncbi:carbohydrate kinase family protein [Candidatus Peregrinibacteria bacterium]|nr:carbohydrate kinase family protein [Candidatus Peregrinibacteria bacterium]